MRLDRSVRGELQWGMKIPNVPLSTLNDETVMLHDLYQNSKQNDKALVLIAGSVSWPPLRQTVQELNSWYDLYKQHLDFLLVYINEAHASDGWRLGNFVDIPNHKCIEDRKKAANMLINKFGLRLPVVLDTMTNEFDKAFAVWPERYYIAYEDQMVFVAEPTHEFGFDRTVLHRQIRNHYDHKLQKLQTLADCNESKEKELTVVD